MKAEDSAEVENLRIELALAGAEVKENQKLKKECAQMKHERIESQSLA